MILVEVEPEFYKWRCMKILIILTRFYSMHLKPYIIYITNQIACWYTAYCFLYTILIWKYSKECYAPTKYIWYPMRMLVLKTTLVTCKTNSLWVASLGLPDVLAQVSLIAGSRSLWSVPTTLKFTIIHFRAKNFISPKNCF